MKVSFILPIYNVEKYLGECVESILQQTYRDFEVVLVDDGSPDNSPALCDAYAEKDSRVRVVHKQNGGLSDARNAGLAVAKGDYVIFVDSDDFWVGKDSLQQLMEVVDAHPECDFISFNCSYYYQNTKTYKKWVAFDEKLAIPTDKDTAMRSLVASGTMPMSACLKVISRKSLLDMGLVFQKGILSEDIPWFINLLEGSKKCMFVNHYVYAYRQNVSGSITHSGGERSFNCLFDILKSELDKIEKRSFSAEAKLSLYSFLAYEYCILLSMLNSLTESKERRKELYAYKWLLKYTDNPKVSMTSKINGLFGIRVTEWVLRLYNWVRKMRE
jgi:glycosyltransferase involved in cell wall biosynthesis